MRDSRQRETVLSVVNSSNDHPSAETILLRCKSILPTINIATVYRNLNSLVDENKIRRIHTDKGDRFDHTLSPHAHFRCENCLSFSDVLEIDLSSVLKGDLNGVNKISSVDFVITGLCENCKEVKC